LKGDLIRDQGSGIGDQGESWPLRGHADPNPYSLDKYEAEGVVNFPDP
jgi:hypothetical protein